LVLILAADQTFEWHRPRRRLPIDQEEEQHPGWKQQWVPTTEDPWHDIEPLTDEQLDKVKQESGVDQTSDVKELDIPILEGEETQAQRLIDEAEAKNVKLERELEAVKATAENLKKKLGNWLTNLRPKK